jgi:hypothetical protein
MEVPKDFAKQLRKEFEKQLTDEIRRAGVVGGSVSLDRNGGAVFSGPENSLRRFLQNDPRFYIGSGVIRDHVIKPSRISSDNAVVRAQVIKAQHISSGSKISTPRKLK